MSVKCESCGKKSARQVCSKCMTDSLGIKLEISRLDAYSKHPEITSRTMGRSSRLPDLDYYDNLTA